VKEVGLLIDLYQSPTQEESVLRQAASGFFIPLVKLIKKYKNIKVSINIPLSTLELLDRYGFHPLISEIKDLYENERVEIVGSAAYNPLLPDFPSKIIEDQIILNEYALGYYFGSKQGFEGEPSIMIRDVEGFIPPILAVNDTVLNTVRDLNYSWVLADPNYTSTDSVVSKLEGSELRVVVPNNGIGDLFNLFNIKSFDEVWNDFKLLKDSVGDKVVVVINNDLYHIQEDTNSDFYKKKITFIDQLIENLFKENIVVSSVRDVIKNIKLVDIKYSEINIKSSKSNVSGGEIGALVNEGQKNIKVLKNIESTLIKATTSTNSTSPNNDYSTLCMWNNDELNKVTEVDIHNMLASYTLLNKCIALDYYLYAYMIYLGQGGTDPAKASLGKYVQYLQDLVKYRADKDFTEAILPFIDELLEFIK